MRRLLASALLLSVVGSPVEGQTLRDRFSQLFTFGNCGEPLCLDVNAAVHGDHYIPSVVQGENNLIAFLNGAIGQSLSNLPFGAATSGVTFSFEGGTPVATAVSPGPIFGERAQTLGRGRLVLAANLTGISFDNVRGEPLSNLALRFAHQNVGAAEMGDPSFENDVIEVRSDIDLSLLVTSLLASYGIGDRIDIGVAVPIVHASLSGASEARIDPWQTPSPHAFGTQGDPSLVASSSTEGSATGIGDVAVRLKVNAYEGGAAGLALVGDVRLPTGDEENFLGTGDTNVRVFAVGSATYGNFSPHINAGYFYTNGENQSNRALATVGFDHLVSPMVTIAGELMGSLQLGTFWGLPQPVTYTVPETRTLALTDIPDRKDHIMQASFGAKFSPGADFRILGNVLFPLTNAGISPTAVWTVGLERSF